MDPKQLFEELLYLQTLTKQHHLAVSKVPGSYAMHIALGDYYSTIEGMTDTLIESYQGKYGVIKNLSVKESKITGSIAEKLKAFCSLLETKCPFTKESDSYLCNQIDEIVMTTYQTIYKLENLN